MSDPMSGIEEDVRFDHDHAYSLIHACFDASDTIREQTMPRYLWLSHGLVDFEGYYAQLFEQNGDVQASDATLLATRLDEVGTAVGDLKRAAKAEQERRETARAWKKRQDERGFLGDVAAFLWGQEKATVGPPDPEPQLEVSTPAVQPRQALEGAAESGVSSGRPANLRDFATKSTGGNDVLREKLAALRTAYTNFTGSCGWGSLEAAGVVRGFESYIAANDNDVAWANAVAGAFEAAGGEGVVTAPNAAIHAGLDAANVDLGRKDLKIEPPQAFGADPTTGYANDPVNTATGNFLEPETDVSFDGGCSALMWGRMYNSLNPAAGGFGPGWSSWTEAGLRIEGSSAWWRLFDGREILFPREGDGWGRATTEAFWLVADETGGRISDNAGGWWRFDGGGRLVGFAAGEGFRVSLTWGEGRLQRIEHERGRWIDVRWEGERVVAVQASDGRRVDYTYDDGGRLIEAGSSGGVRRYVWDEAGFLARVIDADGVVEVDNTYDSAGRVASQVSQHGRESRFTYLPGHATVVADVDGSRSNTWVHDARGRLIRIVDAEGHATSLARDRHGNVVLATERDGGVTASQYDDRSRLVARLTPTGARLENTWDEVDRLTEVRVDSGGSEPSTTRFSYDQDSRLPSSIVDGCGAETRMRWERGQLVEVTDPTGVEFHITYDSHGDVVAMRDGAGNVSRLERDDQGRIVASITPTGNVTRYEWVGEQLAARIDPDGARWGFEYSPAGRLTATVDPLGARTVVEHDTAGEVSSVTDPLGRVTASFHDDLGNLAATVLPDGRRWEYLHDALSRLVAVIDPEGARWDYSHDVMGQVVRQQDPTGRAWVTGHSAERVETWWHPDVPNPPTSRQVTDRIGRVISITTPEGGVHRIRYDACGRPVEHVDPVGGRTTVTRDPAGRVLQVQLPDGGVTAYGYDPVTGRLISHTDALGRTTTFVTDPDNHLVAEINPLGEETRYSHDPCGRVTEVVDPVHGRATWKYDRCGRVVATWSRFLGKRRFHYDQAGQLVEAVDALGRSVRYDYDVGGRATTVTDPLGNITHRVFNHLDLNTAETDPLGRTKQYDYDAVGRLIGHVRASGERLEWTHDRLGNVEQVIANGVVVATHHHDWSSNSLTVEDATDPGSPVIHTLRWNHNGQLVEQSRDDAVTRWEHDLLGRCTAVTTPNDTTTRYEYDPTGSCTRITTPAGEVTQVFDDAGRLIESRSQDSRQTWTYTKGRVTHHLTETAEGTTETHITHDPDGRISSITEDGITTRYRHDPAGQLIESIDHDGRTHTWSYDPCGRLVEEHDGNELIRYVHDAAGQLLEQHSSTGTIRYGYNADGKRVTEDGPGGVTTYTWSALGWLTTITGPTGITSLHVNALCELARVNDTDLFWNTSNSNPIQIGEHSIVATPTGTAIDNTWHPAGWRTGRTTPSNPWDTFATTTVDGIGITSTGGITINGLDWLTHRTYHPQTRSFLTPDPLPAITGSSTSGNPYSYTTNNPLHAQDPLGLKPVTDAELEEYNHRHSTGSFWERNRTAVIGAGIALVGAVVSFIPIPGAQIIGGAIFSGGMNIVGQGLKKPGQPPDWKEVGISAAFGAAGGWVSGKFVTPWVQKVIGPNASKWKDIGMHALAESGLGAGTGAVSGIAGNIYNKVDPRSPKFWQEVGASAIQGAAEGLLFGGVGRAKNLRIEQSSGLGQRHGMSVHNNDAPAVGTSDITPSSSKPTEVVPRRAAFEPTVPRRSTGTEAPITAVPRRAMPIQEARRALHENNSIGSFEPN